MPEVALEPDFACWNFCQIHSSPWVTPAMKVGLVDDVWTLERLLREACQINTS